MDEIIKDLQARFPDFAIGAGESQDGYWVRVQLGDWLWERTRLTQAQSALYFAEQAMMRRSAEILRDHHDQPDAMQ
jgi:hypothetical protein